jgi:hypothetical protein
MQTVKRVWLGIVALTALVATAAVAGAAGLIAGALAGRLVGAGLGLMIANTGNLLPKLRPFSGLASSAASVERFSGWLLTLTGTAWVALFVFSPLPQARAVAGVIGAVAVGLLAVRWGALAWATWLARRHEGLAAPPANGPASWGLTSWLLFAFLYVLVIACVKFLVDQKQLANELSMWVLAGFWLLYAALSAAFDRRRVC